MARNPATGSYTYPDGTRGAAAQTIYSARYNTFIDDLAVTLNSALPINMGGTGATLVTGTGGARDNLKVEVSTAGQPVTNYDSQPWESGSFYSSVGAVGSPDGAGAATNPYLGTAQIADANTGMVQARNLTTNVMYTRKKIGGVWSAWSIDGSAAFVAKAGDTMIGDLHINKSTPTLFLEGVPGASNAIGSWKSGQPRWSLHLGNQTPEGGANAGSDFGLMRFTDAGAFIDQPISVVRSTGNVSIPQALNVGQSLGVNNGLNVTAGGLSVTGNTVLNNAVTVNSTLNTSGVVTAPSFTQTGAVFTINSGQFHYNGSGYFVFLSGAFQVLWNAANCPAVFAANGYQKFANGLTMQWGVASGGGAASVTVTLPIAFPNQIFGVICAPAGDPGVNVLAPAVQVANNAQIVIYPRYVLSGGTVGNATQSVYWLAFGF